MTTRAVKPAHEPHEAPSLDALAGRFTLRLEELAAALGISRRALERERSAGRFPRPDMTIGRMPLWRPETIRQWIESEKKSLINHLFIIW